MICEVVKINVIQHVTKVKYDDESVFLNNLVVNCTF